MDPRPKNATQPFVYYTNKAVTKARERDFPSLFEAFFFVSHCLFIDINLVVALMSSRHFVHYIRICMWLLSPSTLIMLNKALLFFVSRLVMERK